MCELLLQSINEILSWPYNPNESGDAFDDRVALRLAQVTHAILCNGMPKPIPNGKLIVRQPNGSQQYPDILLLGWKHPQAIEIKRSSTGSAVWNSGLPVIEGVYIYNGKYKNIAGTTAVLGEDICTVEEAALLNYIKHTVHIGKDYHSHTLNKLTTRWQLQHIRPMFKEETKK